ncbi:MAG: hypothetical protein ACXABY_37300 [Candidatus Thorarchaeota archaeon]|jgi:hypothetical protein
MGFREDEAKALEAAKEAARQRKLEALQRGQSRKRAPKSPQQQANEAAKKLRAAKARSKAALENLRESANQSLDKPKRDESKQRERIDQKLREIQGLNQTTDSNQ